ncbi:MAG: hypothetical protein HWD85_00185 [Flavobacteriaceae bacterium]|nr:hypothetical protein [Flavobacteriaceae bacterium]
MIKTLKYIGILVIFWSCKDQATKQQQVAKKPEMYITTKHTAFLPLLKTSKKGIGAWNEYTQVSEKLQKFLTISATEALDEALQLSDNIKKLKDSIRPKELQNASFKTRIHVLENEALRLKDMTYIVSISAKEVNHQVDKILEAFSATNSKINTVYSQLEVEKEILLKEEITKQ